MFPFYSPCKHQKTSRFLTFSGAIEVEHWLKIGLYYFFQTPLFSSFIKFTSWVTLKRRGRLLKKRYYITYTKDLNVDGYQPNWYVMLK